mmetsp:Transcript_93042/g.182287  ORF Transcript_93042/g.182287 Transcript_93042/m.182287 type:complete len:956 (+) Transcript_93042:99-2966(+)
MAKTAESAPLLANDVEMQQKDDGNVTGQLAADLAGMAVKFQSQNAKFWNNLTLAIVLSAYMTIFGLPIYSDYIHYSVFGEKDMFVDGEVVSVCGPNMMGLKVNEGTPKKPDLVAANSTHLTMADEDVDFVWCGFLPGAYQDSWPGVVQTAMFTVLCNTGTTVKLAWQCIAGTFCAVVNVYFMCVLFPQGASDPNYMPVVAWVDLVVVIFLFLASKADVNTMIMGICWTVCLMLHFMNPTTGPTTGSYPTGIPFVNYDGETTVVLLTAMMGCIIAVVATIFPKPLLNIRRVHDDALEIVNGIDVVFKEAIDYYKCQKPGALRFQVFAKMQGLKGLSSRVSSNLADSYWETFNLCGYGKIRLLYNSMGEAVGKAESVVFPVRSALDGIKFGEEHSAFTKELGTVLSELHKETAGCLRLCAQCCKDGQIEAKEKDDIRKKVNAIKEKQQDLSNKYQVVMGKMKHWLSPETAPDSLFIFALSQWAKDVEDWATDLADFEAAYNKKWCSGNVCVIAMQQLGSLFDPVGMFAKEQLRFTAMNEIPLLVTFAMALYIPTTSVFIQYSSTMPSMLAVLVTYDYGATFFKNLQRLMGVTFGNTLPLLLMSVIELFDCTSYMRFGLHMTSIFVYYVCFTFMYYSSEHWSTIGCLIGAFGCYTLFRPCNAHLDSDFSGHYKGIAQTIIAMMLKMLVSYLLAPQEPRDLAVQTLKTAFDETEEAIKCFCEGVIEDTKGVGLEVSVQKVKKAIATCAELGPKCDPIVQMVPGTRTSFKKSLYDFALEQMHLVLGDLEMLVLAMQGHQVEHTQALVARISKDKQVEEAAKKRKAELKADAQEQKIYELMQSQRNWAQVTGDVKETTKNVFGVCYAVLQHATEEPLGGQQVQALRNMSNLTKLDGLEEFYDQISEEGKKTVKSDQAIFDDKRIVTQLRRTRIGVVANALSLLTEHCAAISAKCFEHMLYF